MDSTQILCHRCSSVLSADALFCTQCGAPQLVLTEADAQRVVDERTAVPSGATPPRVTAGRIRWRPVIHIVVAIAAATGAAALLGSVVPAAGFVGSILLFLGPTFCLGFYQRRVRGATINGGIGARIGLALGICLSAVILAVDAGSGLIDRYTLHHGAQLDQEMNAAVQQKMGQFTANYAASHGAPPAAYAQQMMQSYLQLLQSPDGHAGMALASASMVCTGILAYCILSGALLGWLKPMPPRKTGIRG